MVPPVIAWSCISPLCIPHLGSTIPHQLAIGYRPRRHANGDIRYYWFGSFSILVVGLYIIYFKAIQYISWHMKWYLILYHWYILFGFRQKNLIYLQISQEFGNFNDHINILNLSKSLTVAIPIKMGQHTHVFLIGQYWLLIVNIHSKRLASLD